MVARAQAGVPLVIGTSGTCGADQCVDWMYDHHHRACCGTGSVAEDSPSVFRSVRGGGETGALRKSHQTPSSGTSQLMEPCWTIARGSSPWPGLSKFRLHSTPVPTSSWPDAPPIQRLSPRFRLPGVPMPEAHGTGRKSASVVPFARPIRAAAPLWLISTRPDFSVKPMANGVHVHHADRVRPYAL